MLTPPLEGDDWLGLTEDPLPAGAAADWPCCRAVAQWCSSAAPLEITRRGAKGSTGWSTRPTRSTSFLASRRSHPRCACGGPTSVGWLCCIAPAVVDVGESSVIVVASSPHRPAAFEAARFGIDTLKATVPIWKRERWSDGESWGLESQHITEVGAIEGGES